MGELKYFFEPLANSIERASEWAPNRAIYTINQDALNERFDYTVEKQKDTYRIITLGDSFTYGLHVDTKDNWTELLEDKLNKSNQYPNIKKFEVINLGVQGYDIRYTVERFKKRGQKYKPDLIVWLLIDFERITELIIPKYNKIQKKFLERDELEKAYSYIPWILARQEYLNETGSNDINNYQLTALSLLSNYYKGCVVLITPPWLNKSEKNILYLYQSQNNRIQITDILNEVLSDDTNRFVNDGHPNPKGHEAIAKSLFQYLINKEFNPCN